METVYINNGEIYKTTIKPAMDAIPEGKSVECSTRSSDGVESLYVIESKQTKEYIATLDTYIHVTSLKDDGNGSTWVKKYRSSTQFLDLLGTKKPSAGVDINSLGFSLCPSIDTWGGIGEIEGTPLNEFVEVYFNVTSNALMSEVAGFYSLPNPLWEGNDLDTNRSEWNIMEIQSNSMEVVLGSIVFKNNTPTLLKIYKFDNAE